MCYEPKDRPPDPPGVAGKARGEDLELKAADGNRFAAYQATPEQPATSQVLIYPDVRGLHPFYKELALRFAQIGISALAIDYFGRTAGLTARDESFQFGPHVQQLTGPTIFQDARAGLASLRAAAPANLPIFSVGFCLGGTISLLSGAQDLGLAGVIAFYAGLTRQLGGNRGTTLDLAPSIRVPVLGLFGEADQGIPPSDVAKLDQALDRAGVEHQIITYPGAPHSFFDRKATEFAEASADAWRRVLAFIQAHR